MKKPFWTSDCFDTFASRLVFSTSTEGDDAAVVSGVDPVVGMVVGVVFILEVAPPFTFITCTDYEAPT